MSTTRIKSGEETSASFACLVDEEGSNNGNGRRSDNLALTAIRRASKRKINPSSSVFDLKRSISNSVERNLTGNITLHQACKTGDTALVRRFIEEGSPSLDACDELGFTPLHCAARFNQSEVIRLLLSNGADPNKFNLHETRTFTPLHTACWYNAGKAARELVRSGSDVNSFSPSGHQAIHCAARRADSEILEILLTEGVSDPNAVDNEGISPLHIAAANGREEVLKTLLIHNANLELRNHEGLTPAQVASREGHVGALKLLVQSAENKGIQACHVLCEDITSQSCLRIAVENKEVEIARVCIEYGCHVSRIESDHTSLLHVACIHGDLEMAQLLVSHNADLNLEDGDGMTPLLRASLSGNCQLISFLLDQGARVLLNPDSSCPAPSPLMCAVKRGHLDAVRLLLSRDTPISIRDINGRCCLHVAVYCDDVTTLRLLLENGGKRLIDLQDKSDKTPLHFAAIGGNMQMVTCLLEAGANPSIADDEEKIPLHHAAEVGDLECIEALVQASPDSPQATDHRLRTPLAYAAMSGHAQCVEYLIGHGAPVTLRDDDRLDALLLSAKASSPEVIQSLLDHGADIESLSKNRASSLSAAAFFGNTEVVRLLLNQGARLDNHSSFGAGCLDAAIRGRQKDVCMEIVKHSRWREALLVSEAEKHDIMKSLIGEFPTAAKVVMDKCVIYSKHLKTDDNFSVTYNFEFMESCPEGKKMKKMGTHFFGPQCMLEHRHRELLFHPLAKELINRKWVTVIVPILWLYVVIYAAFILNLSNSMTCFRNYDLTTGEYKGTGGSMCTPESLQIQSIVLGTLSALSILGHFYRMIVEGWGYAEKTSLLKLTTFLFALITSVMGVFPEFRVNQFSFGVITVLFAFLTASFLIQSLFTSGIYVTMLFVVLKTLLKVVILFMVLFMAFAVIFSVLISRPDPQLYRTIARNKTVQIEQPFQTLYLSILKVAAMTIGELEYTRFFVEQHNTYPTLTNAIFICFCVFMPIVLMNLLIGLAVGDIESVRINAEEQLMALKIHAIYTTTRQLPVAITRRFYKPTVIRYPNREIRSLWTRLKGLGDILLLGNEQEATENRASDMERVSSLTVRMQEQEERMKALLTEVSQQREILKRIMSALR
ncbi:transient receptor potential cation channel subfamily A member 1 isoform X2 [Nematostella vectensis]|uniref:transient receptor potential cation channel subfamily A member 1 isoform X2 n=1 Tax=Nematostella vectensis TaxID=45351 RepID=UPI00138FD9B2|nr:transient receptor potential cation channel subfamily A member 1 isoform X2 [Nematostella vectensis]